MSGPGIDEGTGKETLEQHQQIGFFLERLEHSVAALDTEGGDVEQLRAMVAQIESFKDRLLEHHNHEESRVFQGIVDRFPEAEGQVLMLTAQHERMVEVLEMARIHAQHDDASGIAALRDDLHEFIRTIRQHERIEEALLQRALQAAASS
jgi:hemerythrin-like domain-containing protein